MVICPHCRAENADGARFCGVCGQATQPTHPVTDPRLGAPSEPPSLIGREIAGRFRILAKLGEGGMGTVYRAEQMSLKRTVALKLLRPEVAASPPLVRRFNAEAEAVAKLNHPNTVGIYDFGQDSDGTLFISMEFIEGRSLRAVVHTEAPLPVRRALGIASQVCASLIDAHAHSIVHRDLKPDNVMLQDRGKQRDVVRVLDFGIAKLRDDSRQSHMAMTQAGDMLGTPQYMAPEQIRGERIDGRVDIYAMGCMIYEMVTGRLPYDAPNVMALLSKHLLEAPVPPSQRRPDLQLPRELDELVLGAMAKDPNSRAQTMEEYAERIAAVHAMLPTEAPSFVPSGPPPPGHHPYNPPPPPHSVQVPLTPPPQVFAPTGPPPVTPVSGAPGLYSNAPPYQSPPQPGPEAPDRTLLWIVLAVLFIAGGGVAAYFLSADIRAAQDGAGDSDTTPSDPDDPWSQGPSVSGQPAVAVALDEPVAPTPAVPVVPVVPEPDVDVDQTADMADMGVPANITLKQLPGFQLTEAGGIKMLARTNPQLTIILMPPEVFVDMGSTFTVTVLGSARRATKTVITADGVSVENTFVELAGPGYQFAVLLMSIDTHPSVPEIGKLLDRAIGLPTAAEAASP